MADAPALGAGGETHESSNLSSDTLLKNRPDGAVF